MTDELDPEVTPAPDADAPSADAADAPSADAADAPSVPDGPSVADVEEPSGMGAVIAPFFNAIVAPKECWAALDAKPILSVWIAVWIMVFSTAMAIYNLPLTQRVMVQSTVAALRAQGNEIPPEQLDSMRQNMMMVGSIFAYGSAVFLLIMIAISALAIWVMGALLGGAGVTFSRAFGVAAAAAVIRPLLYGLYATIILAMNPPEIRRVEDATTMTPTLGLDLVLSGADTPVWLHAIYARVDLFLLWYAVLIVTGCVGVMKLSKGQGITIATILWLLGTMLAVGGVWVQSLNAG